MFSDVRESVSEPVANRLQHRFGNANASRLGQRRGVHGRTFTFATILAAGFDQPRELVIRQSGDSPEHQIATR
jgi:hypothetical protein